MLKEGESPSYGPNSTVQNTQWKTLIVMDAYPEAHESIVTAPLVKFGNADWAETLRIVRSVKTTHARNC